MQAAVNSEDCLLNAALAGTPADKQLGENVLKCTSSKRLGAKQLCICP